MTAYTITSGQTSNGLTLNSGDMLTVSSGGTASSTLVSGGTEYLQGGSANATVVRSGLEFVQGGAIATNTLVSGGGIQIVQTNALDRGTTLSANGQEMVEGGTVSGATVASGGTLLFLLGSGGLVSGTIISAGGVANIGYGAANSGGTASGGTILFSGRENVQLGGTTVADTVSSGGIEIVSSGGTASGTIVSSGGTLVAFDGGTLAGVVSAGGSAGSGGVIVLGPNNQLVTAADAVSGATIVSGGIAFVQATGSAMSFNVVSGGVVSVFGGGAASRTTINGGSQIVSSGGTANGTTVTSGAEIVSSGGTTRGILVSGAFAVESVYLGGSAAGGAVSNGGNISLQGTATGLLVGSGGVITALLGGADNGAFIGAAGSEIIAFSGSASTAMVLSGGSQTISAGGVAVQTTVSSGGVQTVISGGVTTNATVAGKLVLSGATATATGTLSLQSGAVISAATIFNSGAGVQAVISGFTSANTIDITAITSSGATLTSSVVSGNTMVTVTSGGSSDSFTFAGTYTSGFFNLGSDLAGHATIANGTPCYCPGTLIETASGETPVEQLAIGDHVRTAAGKLRPIRWIGRRAYAGQFAAGKPHVLPVRIAAGALGDGLPRRDLVVSPLHAMFIDDVLIPAAALVNGASIVQLQSVERVEYIHIELDSHDVILAEGAPSETFVDDDSRGMFHNAADYAVRYPDAARTPARYCAPRLEDGPALEDIRQRIAKRSTVAPGRLYGAVDEVSRDRVRGWAHDPTSGQPVRLHITADGVPFRTVTAGSFRPDLLAAGIGTGHHGFDVTIPGGFPPGAVITVARAIDGATLGSTPAQGRLSA